MSSHNGSTPPFAGFSSPNYTQVPDELFDLLMPELKDAELRVLLYIIRRTFGFKRESDNISLSQLVDGIRTTNGRVLDRGTGLSKATVARALSALREKGIITAQRNRSVEKGNEATTYRLRFKGDPVPDPLVSPVRQAPLSQPQDKPLSQQRDIQETGKQETDGKLFRKAAQTNQTRTGTLPETVPEGRKPAADASNGQSQGRRPLSTAAAVLSVLDSAPATAGEALAVPTELAPAESPGFQRLREQALALRETLPLVDGKPSTRPGRPKRTAEEIALREEFARFVEDMATKLNDEAPLSSSLGRFVNDYRRAKELHPTLTPSDMISLAYETYSRTQYYSPTIKKRATRAEMVGVKSKMAYWFELLEVRLGLKDDHQAQKNVVSPPH